MKSAQQKQTESKAATGNASFYEMSHGGLPRGRTTLLVLRLYVAGSTQNSAKAIGLESPPA